MSRLWQLCRKLSNTLIVSVRRSKVDIQGMVCGYLVNTGKYFDSFLEVVKHRAKILEIWRKIGDWFIMILPYVFI